MIQDKLKNNHRKVDITGTIQFAIRTVNADGIIMCNTIWRVYSGDEKIEDANADSCSAYVRPIIKIPNI